MLNRLAFGLAMACAAQGAFAQTVSDIQAKKDSNAYASDGKGNVVRSQFGLCWRSGSWTEGDAMLGCDGALAPPVARAIAPEVVAAPAPGAAPVAAAPSPALAASPQTAPRCDFTVALASDRIVDAKSAGLNKAMKNRLDHDVIDRLAGCAGAEVVIATVAGSRARPGSRSAKLSEKRAHAISTYLKKKGVASRIETGNAATFKTAPACNAGSSAAKCAAADAMVVIQARGLAG